MRGERYKGKDREKEWMEKKGFRNFLKNAFTKIHHKTLQ